MTPSKLAATISVCLLAASLPSVFTQAAPVKFSQPVTLADERDIITTGAFDRAVSFGGADQTVNGVKFAAGNVGAGTTSMDIDATTLDASSDNYIALGGSATFAGGEEAPFSGLSTAYKSLLGSGAYANTTKGTLTLTLHDLKKGTTYLIQFFVNDSRKVGRHETVRSGGASSEALAYSSTGTTGGVGQYVVGIFTADDPRQVFVLTPEDTASDDAQINAFQLRVVPPPSVPVAVPPRKGK